MLIQCGNEISPIPEKEKKIDFNAKNAEEPRSHVSLFGSSSMTHHFLLSLINVFWPCHCGFTHAESDECITLLALPTPRERKVLNRRCDLLVKQVLWFTSCF